MTTPLHHAEWVLVRHLIFRLCVISTCASIIANFLPNEKFCAGHPLRRFLYELLIFIVAVLALNWRSCIPGLDGEWMGFKSHDCCDEPIGNLKSRLIYRKRRERLAQRKMVP